MSVTLQHFIHIDIRDDDKLVEAFRTYLYAHNVNIIEEEFHSTNYTCYISRKDSNIVTVFFAITGIKYDILS